MDRNENMSIMQWYRYPSLHKIKSPAEHPIKILLLLLGIFMGIGTYLLHGASSNSLLEVPIDATKLTPPIAYRKLVTPPKPKRSRSKLRDRVKTKKEDNGKDQKS